MSRKEENLKFQSSNKKAMENSIQKQQTPIEAEKGMVTYDVAGQQVQLSRTIVRNYLTKGNGNVPDADIVQFIQICKFNQLNPFLGEAYLVKYDGSPAQMVVSKEALMKRAEANEHYQGFEAGIIVRRKTDGKESVEWLDGTFRLKDDILLGGWSRVYRDDRKTAVVQTVSLAEYDTTKSTWKTKPATMIRKVAMVQAFREAFPVQLGAMYTKEEIGVEDVDYEEVKDDVDKEISENANQGRMSVESGQDGTDAQNSREMPSEAKKQASNGKIPFEL